MNLKKDKKGFSLIELIVVMAAIGLLSSLALGSYFTYRQSSILNIAVEDFVSQVRLQRAQVAEQCLGLSFTYEADNFVIEQFAKDFRSKKVWDPIAEDWTFSGCSGERLDLEPFILERDINLVALNLDGEAFEDDFEIIFLPPKGEVMRNFNSPREVEFVFGFDETERSINFNLENGQF
jgi:prepilin-type N-terminal cleavage/methylation domain-containing protein